MLIVCPSCTTSYQVPAASLGTSGRSVRCARCRTVWLALPTLEPAAASAEDGRVAAAAAVSGWTAGAERAETPVASADPAAAQGGVPAAPADAPVMSFTGLGSGHDDAVASVEAPPLAPDATQASADAPAVIEHGAQASGEDIESFAARRAHMHEKRRLRMQLRTMGAVIAALVALELALVGWRADVVALLPQTASFFAAMGLPVNARGLVFDAVASGKEVQDGSTILVVEGNIVNVLRRPVEVPRLRFAVRDQSGHEIYAWTALPARPVLGPGESLPFRSRLASPPAEGRDVIVRFFNRRDAPATVR